MSYAEQELIIKPGRGIKHYWRDMWNYRELFYFLAWRDITVRYKQTVIGIAWSVIKPVMTMIVFSVIFGRLAEEVARMPAQIEGMSPIPDLDPQARRVFALFEAQAEIGSAEVAALLGVSSRHARSLLQRWAEEGWLELVEPAPRVKRYRLKAA